MQVSKPMLVAAGAVFLALFGTVLFLLGRETGRRRAPPQAAAITDPWPVATPPATAPAAAPMAAAPTAAPPLPTTAPVPAPPPAHAVDTAPLPPLTLGADRPAAPPTGTDEASAVRDYFMRMQAIQTVGPALDTSEFANKLLASSMNGDTSGLDELVRVSEEGARRAAAITPPAELADYHQRMLALLGESAGMVRQIKTALTGNDPSALGALASAGTSLQSRATALEDEARQIKSKYGLR